MNSCQFYRDRSVLYISIHDNGDSINISANDISIYLINSCFPDLECCSPTGWKKSPQHDNLSTLWLPNDCIDEEEMKSFVAWANNANNHIWLSPNRNTRDFFTGEEIDHCVACDWNYDFEAGRRTLLGYAEWLLKYHADEYSENERARCEEAAYQALIRCINCLPIDPEQYVIVPIPAVKRKQNKLAWKLAEMASSYLEIPICPITLVKDKPEMKQQPVANKIRIWRSIYQADELIDITEELYGRKVLIVDDMYQSGASIWCLAEYLKQVHQVESVIAISLVKSRRDSDNT